MRGFYDLSRISRPVLRVMLAGSIALAGVLAQPSFASAKNRVSPGEAAAMAEVGGVVRGGTEEVEIRHHQIPGVPHEGELKQRLEHLAGQVPSEGVGRCVGAEPPQAIRCVMVDLDADPREPTVGPVVLAVVRMRRERAGHARASRLGHVDESELVAV